jgi:hypothetical protein
MVFKIFGCIFVLKKFLLTSMKSLTNSEILPIVLLKKLVPAFKKSPVTLRVVPEAPVILNGSKS